jgi:periplasmic divalent cation tolerance protein
MSSYSVVYTTVDSAKLADEVAEHLVKERLAACVNMHKSEMSVYMWEGALKKEKETVLLIKTRTDMVEKVMAEIKHLHTYAVPTLYSFLIDQGDPTLYGLGGSKIALKPQKAYLDMPLIIGFFLKL